MLKMVPTSHPVEGSEDSPELAAGGQERDADRDVPWYKLGACRGMDIDLFFPRSGEKTPDEVVEACNSCIVRKECEAAGQSESGIWGGLSERARRRRVRQEDAVGEKSTGRDLGLGEADTPAA